MSFSQFSFIPWLGIDIRIFVDINYDLSYLNTREFLCHLRTSQLQQRLHAGDRQYQGKATDRLFIDSSIVFDTHDRLERLLNLDKIKFVTSHKIVWWCWLCAGCWCWVATWTWPSTRWGSTRSSGASTGRGQAGSERRGPDCCTSIIE